MSVLEPETHEIIYNLMVEPIINVCKRGSLALYEMGNKNKITAKIDDNTKYFRILLQTGGYHCYDKYYFWPMPTDYVFHLYAVKNENLVSEIFSNVPVIKCNDAEFSFKYLNDLALNTLPYDTLFAADLEEISKECMSEELYLLKKNHMVRYYTHILNDVMKKQQKEIAKQKKLRQRTINEYIVMKNSNVIEELSK